MATKSKRPAPPPPGRVEAPKAVLVVLKKLAGPGNRAVSMEELSKQVILRGLEGGEAAIPGAILRLERDGLLRVDWNRRVRVSDSRRD